MKHEINKNRSGKGMGDRSKPGSSSKTLRNTPDKHPTFQRPKKGSKS